MITSDWFRPIFRVLPLSLEATLRYTWVSGDYGQAEGKSALVTAHHIDRKARLGDGSLLNERLFRDLARGTTEWKTPRDC